MTESACAYPLNSGAKYQTRRAYLALARGIALSMVVLVVGWANGAGAQSGERRIIGWGGFVSNDLLGDGADRWRTGSYMLNVMTAPDWSGSLPTTPLEILEFRLGAEVISPSDAQGTDPNDRPYAGVLSLGVHTHFRRDTAQVSVGVDLVAVGPQTQVDTFQDQLHQAISFRSRAPDASEQVDNGLFPTLLGSITRPVDMGIVRLRPFAEAQVGYETYARLGGDMVIGNYGRGGIFVRDRTTGFENPALTDADLGSGFSVVLGADATVIQDSRLLPESLGPGAVSLRTRLRAGVAYDAGPVWVFFGVSRLSPEFKGQGSGQRVGAVTANVRF